MSGSFSGINTALSAMRYNRVAMDVAGGNIANVATEGYARRRVEGASVGGPSTPAMWSRYDGHGDGVSVSGVNRMTDELLNTRSRREHGTQAFLDVRQTSLERVEAGVGEPGDNGLSNALAGLRKTFHQLVSTPDSQAARAQVISAANHVVDVVGAQARNVEAEASDQRFRLVSDVSEANTVAASLASANEAIASGKANGNDVGTLLDKRDLLTNRLAELTGATATLRSDGGADVTLNGIALVTGNNAGSLSIASGVTSTGESDGSPVSFTVTDDSGTTTVPGALNGEVGGVTDLLNVTLPGYLSGLSAVAQDMADQLNTMHASGYAQDGTTTGTPLFSYDPADVIGSLAVAITDPAQVAASGQAGAGVEGSNADKMATTPTVEGAYQRLVTGLGVQVTEARRRADNQQAVTAQVDSSRDQLSGVDIDEEMVNLLSSQRAYEAAARLMTTLDSVLDTLINRTGAR